jgi:hypothetical protein
MLSPSWRRFVLLLHVVTSLGFLGGVAGFLALAISGATAVDDFAAASSYLAMSTLTWWVIVPLAVASLLIGLVQSLGTPWGLFRYYWVVVKLALTLVALAVLTLQLPTVDLLADAARADTLASLSSSRFSMILHGSGGILVLLVATILSVYKPRGATAYGIRRDAE